MKREAGMKRDIPTQAGIGFTLLVAALTFAVAVIAGIFLFYQSGMVTAPSAQIETPAQSKISLAQAPAATADVRRGSQVEHPPSASPGINPTPAPAQ
jgi:hypothetical protein